MSQLLAVLPPYQPSSSCSGSVNKTSRRNLFDGDKTNTESAETNAKRMRKNSEGEFHSVPADSEKTSTDTHTEAVEKGNWTTEKSRLLYKCHWVYRKKL